MLRYVDCRAFDVGRTAALHLLGKAAQCLSPLALYLALSCTGDSINMPLWYPCLCLFDSYLRDSNKSCLGNTSTILQEVVCFCNTFWLGSILGYPAKYLQYVHSCCRTGKYANYTKGWCSLISIFSHLQFWKDLVLDSVWCGWVQFQLYWSHFKLCKQSNRIFTSTSSCIFSQGPQGWWGQKPLN